MCLKGLLFNHSIVSRMIVGKSLILTPRLSLRLKSNWVGITCSSEIGSGICMSGINF